MVRVVPAHNPIPKNHIDKLESLPVFVDSDEEELERREQIVWNTWLKFYFSGVPFTVRDDDGGTVEKTFPVVDRLFETASAPDSVRVAVVHALIADRRELSRDRVGGSWRVRERWTRNFLIRVPSQLNAADRSDQAAGEVDSEQMCRRISSQLHWLLGSEEKVALAEKGIRKLQIASGPRSIGAGNWHMRQIVTTQEVNYRVRRAGP